MIGCEMEIECMPFLLVSANVGSVFEDPTRLLKAWIKEILDKISVLRPLFLALHLQEVGGKTYEKSMEYVQEFIQNLCDSEELAEYTTVRIYLDEDYNSAEHFTALGNLYFVHQSLHTVKIWNFLTHEWEQAEGKSIHTGNIEAIPTKEKAKFPQHFFPECKWSRKGFLRTRWELNCTVIDFVNIHLFHDASNLAACEEFPSVYCKTRRRALVYTLERFHTDARNGVAPYFVFGDFNFRCDTEGVIKRLTSDLTAHRVQSVKSDSTKLQFRNSEGANVLTIGKKEFSHTDHQSKFKESWLQQFDRELEPLREVLVEYPITFPPSYPYEEEPTMPMNYMSTRCPAWCDRILLSPQARDLVDDGAFSCTDYNIIGENVCMGDHKPVYLSIHVKTLQGTVRCCHCFEHASQSSIVDLKHVESLAQDRAYCLYKSFEFNKILLECRKLDSLICQKAFVHSGERVGGPVLAANQQPLVSINVTDTDNYNVCMCSEYLDRPDQTEDMVDGSICPQCRNIIKMQPVEHRKALISKRLMLSENIIVNRVDMQYLSTYLDTRHEPYTPESAESRSPCPELEIANAQDDFMEDHSIMNITSQDYTDSSMRGVVSPRQLKSKLETLQRTSLCSELDEIEYRNKSSKIPWTPPELQAVIAEVFDGAEGSDDTSTAKTNFIQINPLDPDAFHGSCNAVLLRETTV